MATVAKRRKNYTYLSLDEAVKGFQKNSKRVKARGRLTELSSESIKVLKEKLKDSERCPHDVIVGSKSTMEVTLLSCTLAPTVVSIVGVSTRGALFDKLSRL